MERKESAEMLREFGKAYFFSAENDSQRKNTGIQMLIKAQQMGDPEATFIISKLIFDGFLSARSKRNSEEFALSLMCYSANKGYLQARAFLNAYCDKRYSENFSEATTVCKSGPLLDFDGKPIKFARTGMLTPIDAVLEYRDGKNILTLSANVMFLYTEEEIADPEMFERAIIKGFLSWQGEYTVFNGQKVFVEINLTAEPRVFDNVIVMPITSDVENTMKSVSNVIGTKQNKAVVKDMLRSKRSFAVNGLKWSAKSRKLICIQSETKGFEDYEEIMHVAKHEFGHALGLGDLYESSSDSLAGVAPGTYFELDSYAISDKFYNLVMCDHHGPISNNDIEMVILAFRDNKMQLFQPMKLKGKISNALGKGN